MNFPRNYPVRLNHLHISRLTESYSFPRHYQKSHQLYLVFEGAVIYEADGVDIPLQAGEGLWLAPGCLRAPRSDCSTGSYLVADFTCHHSGFCPHGAQPVRLNAGSRPHALAFYEAGKTQEETEILQLLFARFCLAVDRTLVLPESAVSEPRMERDEEMVRTVEKLMEANLGNPLPLETLSRLAHCSPAGVGRGFRRQLGIPPMEHYRQLRLKRAEELLRSGISIAEAAYSAGFSSSQHLATAFRKQFGRTPTELIKSCTKMKKF